jgi:hypothetical protein
MRRPSRTLVLCCALATGAACASTARPGPEPADPPPAQDRPAQVNRHARAMASFQEAVEQYMALRKKMRADLPRLAADATPEQMHTHQLALAARIREARRTAQPGDIFTPDLRIVIRTLMAQVFGGPDGKALKADIMDENPGRIKVSINDRYPDNVPLSMVPPQVIAGLPKLPPKEMEYRFLGRALILLDIEAHLIVDIMENAIP